VPLLLCGVLSCTSVQPNDLVGTWGGVAPSAVEIQRRLGDILRDVLH
jgi:hypothetical protein